MKGKLIVIEGMDGSGKQTQTTKVFQNLYENGIAIEKISFPNYEADSSILVKNYLTGTYQKNNFVDNMQYVRQMSSFYAVDRVASFMKSDKNNLSLLERFNTGTNLICDRYTTSNILHQSANIKTTVQDIFSFINWIERLEYQDFGLPRPDIVIYLDVPPEISIDNMNKRYGGNSLHDLHENIEHLKTVFELKDTIIEYCKWEKINCCPNNRMLSIDEINDLVMEKVMTIF